MEAAELARRATALGLDVVGAAPAVSYDETEDQIRERRRRGLFADMRFTMARPEASCHPETQLEGTARTVISAALCYWTDGPEPGPGEGRLPRYAWRDHYALLRDRLDALGRSLGGAYRVLVDHNEHVDREGARRAGIGFYGKNTMIITRDFGSWVVLGTLVTEVEVEPTPPLQLDCGRCTLCIDACPTGALDEPGVVDANRCLSYWTQAPAPVPEEYREALGVSVYGCDICQDVCPWNRGVEKRRRHEPRPEPASPNVSLVDWLTQDGDRLVRDVDRLYVPRNHPRWLRRNALHALGNVGTAADLPLAAAFVDDEDPVLADAGAWATGRIARREVVFNHGMSSIPTNAGLGVLAHELRSPVAALGAVVEAWETSDTARRRRLLELAGAAVAAIERLLAEADPGPRRRESLDVALLVRERVDTAALHGPVLLGPLERGLLVDGDPQRLRQALDNLIDNALGHSPEGVPVTVTAIREGRSVVVSVRDLGEGIAAPDLERIFEPGVRATDTRAGQGIGLAVVRAVALAHGGGVEVESEPARGATFRLVLPAAVGAE